MEEKIIQKTVYTAKDGKEFLNKEECRKYEEEFLDKVSYFAIEYNFDLTEGRGFQSMAYVAVVPSRYDSAAVIANKYAIDVLNDGVFAGQGCQVKVCGKVIQKRFEESYFGMMEINTILTDKGIECERYGKVPTTEDKRTSFYAIVKGVFNGKVSLDRATKNPKKGIEVVIEI